MPRRLRLARRGLLASDDRSGARSRADALRGPLKIWPLALTLVLALAPGCHREPVVAPVEDDTCTGARCVEEAEAALFYGDEAGAREPLAIVCEGGDAFACYRLAELHRQGKGGPVDVDKAVALHEQACAGEQAEGCQKRAELAREGHGGPDVELEYQVKACDHRLPDGCMAAADLLSAGAAVESDRARAVELYEEACDLGDPIGCARAGDLLFDPKANHEVASRALRAYVSACTGNNARGCLMAGVSIHDGIGTTFSMERAMTHFKRACFLSDEDACSVVEQIEEAGGERVDLVLSSRVDELVVDGFVVRDLACRMTDHGEAALGAVMKTFVRRKSDLDACAEDGAAVEFHMRFEKGKLQAFKVKGKAARKLRGCVGKTLRKARVGGEGSCEGFLLLGDPHAAAEAHDAIREQRAASKPGARPGK